MIFGVHLTQLRKAIIFLVLAFPRLFLFTILSLWITQTTTSHAAAEVSLLSHRACYRFFEQNPDVDSLSTGKPEEGEIRILFLDRDEASQSPLWAKTVLPLLQKLIGPSRIAVMPLGVQGHQPRPTHKEKLAINKANMERLRRFQPHIVVMLLQKGYRLYRLSMYKAINQLIVPFGNDRADFSTILVWVGSGKQAPQELSDAIATFNDRYKGLAHYLVAVMEEANMISPMDEQIFPEGTAFP